MLTKNISQRLYPLPDPDTLPKRGRWIENPFSNMNPSAVPLVFDGIGFRSVENLYVAAKTTDRPLRLRISQMTPWDAKKFGEALVLRPDWDDVFLAAMWTGLVQRWSAGEAMSLQKMRRPYIEWNNWGDHRWGADVETGRGQNILGRLLEILAEGGAERFPVCVEPAWSVLAVRLCEEIETIHPEFRVAPPQADMFQGPQ